ncbi:MAG: cytochrome c biogenesis protein CcsA, partial [Chitinophagaceae bacterium]
MVYPGEHLLPGQLGHFFVVLALVSSLVASICFFVSANAANLQLAASWKKLGRISFIINAFSLFSIFACLLYIVASHKFEYYYAWEHSSKSLDYRYLLSCIWEGQQGSFLLWTMWHAVIGMVLMRTAKQWEAPVMSVISFVQFFIATMIIGVYIFGIKIGNGAFLLTREFYIDAPFASHADYMSLPSMQDGQGLNQLLQNYWMVIHPPILFLGFASTVVPFSYAIAGLWKKNYSSWTRAAIPWTLFSACILGTGIMMGAAWAYESLTFGGYWAWDPVENASLVPWLVMIAGLHTLVIYNATGNSLRATYLFFILSFVFILYSTYLTRSGDLTDTSVHAFVGSRLNWQLRIFMLSFLIPAATLFAVRYKKIPYIVKEESTNSREFWMFIGSLVFFLSAMFIITATSLPVINKVFGTKFVIGSDPEFAYNRIQIFVACVIGLLMAATQYLKYRDTSRNFFFKRVWVPTAIALIISIFISLFGGITYNKYGAGYLGAIHLAVFAAVYAVVSNASYIWIGLNGKFKAAGGSVAHIGFGLMLVGILISSSKKSVLSYNTTGINLRFDPSSKEKSMENITLLKSVTTDMGTYHATYVNSDSTNKFGNILYFRIDMKKKGSNES